MRQQRSGLERAGGQTVDILTSPQALPHSEEAERAVLAGCLIDPTWIDVLPGIGSASFYFERHRHVWEALHGLREDREAIDVLTVSEHLRRLGLLDAVGGIAFIAGLDVDLPDLSRMDAYAAIVRDRHLRRSALARAAELSRRMMSDAAPTGEILFQHLGAVRDELHTQVATVEWRTIGELQAEVLQTMEATPAGTQAGVPVGIPKLDRILGGFRPGQLIVLAGAPGMGKTSLALQAALHQAERLTSEVAFFSLEMTGRELAIRAACGLASVDSSRVRDGYTSAYEREELRAAGARMGRFGLRVADSGSIMLGRLLVACRQLKAEHRLDVVYLDHLQIMRAEGRWHGHRHDELEEICRQLKAMAKELGVPVVALSQLNRKFAERPECQPQLSDLRASGAIEEYADAVVFTNQRWRISGRWAEEKNTAHLIVAKNRDGGLGTIRCHFEGAHTRFSELATDQQPDLYSEGGAGGGAGDRGLQW